MLKQIIIYILIICTVVQSQSLLTTNLNDSPECQYTDGFDLNLSNGGIKRIRRPFVSTPTVSCLNLQKNEIEDIDNGAFDGLTNLRYLNLAGNKLKHEVYLKENEFQSVEVLVLDEAFYLSESDIEPCYYRHGSYHYCLNEFGFKEIKMSIKTPKLKNLYLRKNNITVLEVESWKENMPNITHLYLSNNKLKAVDFLKFIPSTLTHLYLDNNKIERFVSRSLHALEELILDYNFISTLCGSDNYCENGITLKNAINLKELSLSNVTLETIDPDSLEDLINLEKLNLSNNLIRTISKHTFNNLTNLNQLDLQNNELVIVPDVCSLKKLEILKLSYNKIETIDDRFICNIISLKELSLNQNQLIYISSGAFDGLQSLEKLDLSGNKLDVLPDGWMNSVINLRYLLLNDNLFPSTDSMTLDNCTGLESVNIAGNPLKTLSLKSLMNLPENTVIDLNQIYSPKVEACGCNCAEYRRRYGYL